MLGAFKEAPDQAATALTLLLDGPLHLYYKGVERHKLDLVEQLERRTETRRNFRSQYHDINCIALKQIK